MIIGFEETAKILTSHCSRRGFTPESGKKIFLVDGNVGNAVFGQAGCPPPNRLDGRHPGHPACRSTQSPAISRPVSSSTDPGLIDFSYAAPKATTQ